MGSIIIQFGLGLGFVATWVGMLCLLLAFVAPNLSLRKFLENNSAAYSQRMVQINEDFRKSNKSRISQAGQIFLAIGLSLLILTGVLWFFLKIAE